MRAKRIAAQREAKREAAKKQSGDQAAPSLPATLRVSPLHSGGSSRSENWGLWRLFVDEDFYRIRPYIAGGLLLIGLASLTQSRGVINHD
jgi:hypothetical protein